jgi:plastocyanin
MGLALVLVGACGNSSSSSQSDAPASSNAVVTVDCSTATPAATVTTSGGAYSPMTTTITKGQVVKFVMVSGSNHNVSSTTPNLADDFGATDCKMFTTSGTFSFKCSVHGFMGSIVVQ